MIAVFFDASVLLALLQQYKMEPLLDNILQILEKDNVKLIIPEQLTIEINNNEDRILKSRKDTLRTFRQHANNLKILLDEDAVNNLNQILLKVDKNLPNWDTQSDKIFQKFKLITKHSNAINIETTEQIMIDAGQRALNRNAPFVKNKNSIGDAILLESIIAFQNSSNYERIHFITLNTEDFSDPSDKKNPHPDLAKLFQDRNIEYSINPAKTIEKLLEIKIDDDIKLIFDDMGNMIKIFTEIQPELCLRCEGSLINFGYRTLNGCAGWASTCKNCGVVHLILDSAY